MTDKAAGQVSLSELLIPILRHRYLILCCAFLAAVTGGLIALSQDHVYTSEMSFIPEGGDAPRAGIAAVAGQLGVPVPVREPSGSPQFYVELLQSRAILQHLVADTFQVSMTDADGDRIRRGSLGELLEVEVTQNAAVHRREVIQWLQGAITADIAKTGTGVVEVAVTSPWPELSQALGTRLLELVNDFNVEIRQTRAAAERRFIEERLREAETGLRGAEATLERFLQANRQFQNSPELVFQHERLQRQVAMAQQSFTALRQALENARIAEIRDTPVMTVFESPELPVRPDPRGGVRLRALLGFLAGGLLGMLFVLGRHLLRRQSKQSSPHLQELAMAWDDVVQDFRFVHRLNGWKTLYRNRQRSSYSSMDSGDDVEANRLHSRTSQTRSDDE